jgi:hypothetical protein
MIWRRLAIIPKAARERGTRRKRKSIVKSRNIQLTATRRYV